MPRSSNFSGRYACITIPPTVTATPKPYPPVEKPYYDMDVDFRFEQVDANTLSITNAGGSDVSSLLEIWVNSGNRYLTPVSGKLTSQVGSSAYYSIKTGSTITLYGEFPDCNSVLYTGSTTTPTTTPTTTRQLRRHRARCIIPRLQQPRHPCNLAITIHVHISGRLKIISTPGR